MVQTMCCRSGVVGHRPGVGSVRPFAVGDSNDHLNRTSNHVAYLCQVIPRVDRLIVTRHAPGNQFHFTFPAVVTVTNAAGARAVAASACALPDAPKGAQACPVEFAVSYHLVFAVRGEKGMGGEAIDVNPTGCQSVTGLGTVREAMSSIAFFRLLGSAMGLKNASYLTFRGVFRTGG